MSIPELLGASWARLGAAVIATIGVYLALIVATRVWGLRSFAKFSAFDFAATVATGSILATVALTTASLATGVVAVTTLFAARAVTARLRIAGVAKSAVDNTPILLMAGAEVLHDNLRAAEVHIDDLRAKLREANVLRLSQVRYVVLEATGDISVLHSEGDDPVDDFVMEGVQR